MIGIAMFCPGLIGNEQAAVYVGALGTLVNGVVLCRIPGGRSLGCSNARLGCSAPIFRRATFFIGPYVTRP